MNSPKLQTSWEPDVAADPMDLPGRLATMAPRIAHAVESANVLVANSSNPHRTLLTAMLNHLGYGVTTASDAVEAGAWLSQRPFDILLTDSTMSGVGLSKPSEIAPSYPDMVIVHVTRSGAARESEEAGTGDVISLPCTQGELAVILQRNLTRRSLQRKHAQRFRQALETSNENVLDALLTAYNTRNTETEGHSERVTAYTMEIADALQISAQQKYHIERGALLHDVGKVSIPDRVLHKPDALTEGEWTEMRKHPVTGYQMCMKIEMLRESAQVVLRHHEQWDGSGYPDGIEAEAIPLGARIFAMADALDAITSDRPYRRARSFAAAREEIARAAARQFDPAIVRVFLKIPESRWSFIRANAAM